MLYMAFLLFQCNLHLHRQGQSGPVPGFPAYRKEHTVPQPSQFYITAREHQLQNAGGSLALMVELWVL